MASQRAWITHGGKPNIAKDGDLMVWTRPGGSLGEEVVRDGIESGGPRYRPARVSGAWRGASGRAILRKRLRRSQIPDFFANLPKCVVGIEATQGAHSLLNGAKVRGPCASALITFEGCAQKSRRPSSAHGHFVRSITLRHVSFGCARTNSEC